MSDVNKKIDDVDCKNTILKEMLVFDIMKRGNESMWIGEEELRAEKP